jgi:anaerobic selenocysteine-containing dehydrogenase
MERRDFIKLTAITGTSAALTACGNPEHQLIRFVPDEDIVPGIAEWKPGVCPLCSAGCGLNVRVMDADFETMRNGQPGVVAIKAAKKLEGHPANPINQGALCARGQAAIQLTYHPDRLTQPMKRSGNRGAGEFKPVSWDEAIAELAGKLDALSDRKALAYITRPRRSRRLEVASEFLSRFGAPPPLGFELFGNDVLRKANAASFGREQLPTYDLSHSMFVIGFGADFLGTWNSPVAQTVAYGHMRQGRTGMRGKFVQVESRMSLTGASADEWIYAKPGTEGVVALGIAHVLSGGNGAFADFAPDAVEKIAGVTAKRIERLAKQIGEMKPAVAIAGGPALAYSNGSFHARAVNALNGVLGAAGQPGGIFFTPGADTVRSARPASDLRTLSAQLLLLDDANPVFGTPKSWGVKDALAKIPYIASFGSFVDDTSAHADLILPDHSFLESWTDSLPESGSLVAVASAAGPVMKPLYQTKSTPDVLIEVAGKLKSPIAMPWKTYDEAIKAGFDKISSGAWDDVAKQGGHWESKVESRKSQVESRESKVESRESRVASRESKVPKFDAPKFDGDATTYPFFFQPYASQNFNDGTAAHLPWLQEMPDPMTSAMWSSWVEINPQAAEKLGIKKGDVVEITSSQGSVRAPAILSPGIGPDMVAMPVGQGHETFTRYASRRGANPIAILAPVVDTETGALAWASTRVKIARVADADGSLITFAGELREDPHEHRTR